MTSFFHHEIFIDHMIFVSSKVKSIIMLDVLFTVHINNSYISCRREGTGILDAYNGCVNENQIQSCILNQWNLLNQSQYLQYTSAKLCRQIHL